MWLLAELIWKSASKSIFPNLGTLVFFAKNCLRVIAKKTIRDFWEKYPDCEQQLKAWYQEAENEAWNGPNDIKSNYPSASILDDNRLVFNIKGNHY
jgi:mRNA interferase HigB